MVGLTNPPLVVDLDGTLIHTDMLHESTLKVLRDHPLTLLQIPGWLMKGKAYLKQRLASLVDFDPQALPYHHGLISWLQAQKSEGRSLVLCTASDTSIAQRIANYLGIFDEVIASNGEENLAGPNKAKVLVQRYGQAGFDYVGNSNADLAVWGQARRAVVVNASSGLAVKAASVCDVQQVFPRQPMGFSAWRRMLRLHQWMKNLLLFVPMFAGHAFTSSGTWLTLLVAFMSFSLCASSVYITNDLLDLESDRLHARKRLRPFASGLVPISLGVMIAPMLLAVSVVLGAFVGWHFLAWLLFYFVLTCAYSWTLKRLMLVDCLTLALLYTLRIVAGAAAIQNQLSFWLLAFSVFLFLSLAFVKRYAELENLILSGKQHIHGRGYHTDDAPMIQTMGITSGYVSALVLALYVNSDAVIKLYHTPQVIWGTVPVMLFWVSWMWMQAHRGHMHDDPLVFAVKDKASLFAGLSFTLILLVGTIGWPW